MSTIASFGLCSKSAYENFEAIIKNSQFSKAADAINKITTELDNSVPKLENNKCSGEVFLALFEYFNTVLGVNVRENMESKELGEIWRETTNDFDMIAFFEKEKIQLSALADTIDYDGVSQFINDFFQLDYGEAGRTACDVFLNNLNKLDTNTVLIFRLY